jgi:hypothetical protein
MVDKSELLKLGRRYDKDNPKGLQVEQELGSRFRKTKSFTREDLLRVADWKYPASEEKGRRVAEAIAKNDEATVARISSQVFSVTGTEDSFRVNSLTMLVGVSPVLASVILAFFDPRDYGVFEAGVWKVLLGNVPPNLYTPQNYLKFLAALRKTASKNNLDARTVEKALLAKSRGEK